MKDKTLAEWKELLLEALEGDKTVIKSLRSILYPPGLINKKALELLEKGRGFPVGTIREWKGKKYKKLTSGKWVLTYEGRDTRGEQQAIRNVRRKIAKADTMEDLVEIVRANYQRFQDHDGHILPVVKEFMDAARRKTPKEKKAAPEEETPIPDKKPETDDKEISKAIATATPETRVDTKVDLFGFIEEEKIEPSEGYEFTPTTTKIKGIEVDDYTDIKSNKIFLTGPKENLSYQDYPMFLPQFSQEEILKYGSKDSIIPVVKIDGEDRYMIYGEGSFPVAVCTLDVYAATLSAVRSVHNNLVYQTKIDKKKKAIEKLESLGEESIKENKHLLDHGRDMIEFYTKKRDRRSSMRAGWLTQDTSSAYRDYGDLSPGDTSFHNDYLQFQRDLKQKENDMKIQKSESNSTYTKGQETSYSRQGSVDSLHDSHGVFIKRQNGEKITEEDTETIKDSLDNLFKVFGDKKDMSKKYGLTISHSGNKKMHASTALGIFFPAYKTIGVTAKMGKTDFGFTLAHEFGHFMDHYVGSKSSRFFASDAAGSIESDIAKTFRENMKTLQSSAYQNRTCECFARALEQYFSIKNGDGDPFGEDSGNHPSHENFVKKVMPKIDQFLEERADLLKGMTNNVL